MVHLGPDSDREVPNEQYNYAKIVYPPKSHDKALKGFPWWFCLWFPEVIMNFSQIPILSLWIPGLSKTLEIRLLKNRKMLPHH